MYRGTLSFILNRTIFLSFLLVYQMMGILFGFKIMPFLDILILCVAFFAISMLYIVMLFLYRSHARKLNYLAFSQFVTDIFLISFLVVVSGGIDSLFNLGYLFIILISAFYYSKIYIYLIAVLCTVFYYISIGFIPMLLSTGPVGVELLSIPSDLSATVMIQFVLFFATALFSGLLQDFYRANRKDLLEKETSIRALRRLKTRIVETLRSGVITCRQDGEINFVNSRAAKLFQAEPEEMLGQIIWGLMGLDPDPMQEEVSASGIAKFEHWLSVKSNKRLFGISYCIIEQESGQNGYLFVFQDLTEMKMLEQQQHFRDRMGTVGRMAAGVAHEIRNPLASISGSVQVLKELIPDDATAAELAGIVEKESRRLNEIISAFLTYSRMEAPSEMKTINLVNIFSRFRQLAENDKQLKNIVFDVHVEGEPNEMAILGEESKILQIFWNLIRNSSEAMADTGVIEVRFESRKGDVILCIRDRGEGMTEEQLKDLFTPFQSFRGSGTGLGMSIVYELIKMHHATIDVTSSVGKGTRVKIVFPKVEEE